MEFETCIVSEIVQTAWFCNGLGFTRGDIGTYMYVTGRGYCVVYIESFVPS